MSLAEGDTIDLKVTPDPYVTVRYAGASGDFNPIHIDEAFAQQVGLPGRILHGLWTMAQVARAHTEAGGGPETLRRLSVQFRGMGEAGRGDRGQGHRPRGAGRNRGDRFGGRAGGPTDRPQRGGGSPRRLISLRTLRGGSPMGTPTATNPRVVRAFGQEGTGPRPPRPAEGWSRNRPPVSCEKLISADLASNHRLSVNFANSLPPLGGKLARFTVEITDHPGSSRR